MADQNRNSIKTTVAQTKSHAHETDIFLDII